MKKLSLLILILFITISCEKDYLIPNKEVPNWLKTEINNEEQIIKDSPQLMNAYGAWIRFKWQQEYYFEYQNPLSSSSPRAISTNRDTLRIYVFNTTTDYYKEKCCKEFVWKASKYNEP